MAPAKERPATKTIATNREARHEYFVLEALETGVELKGTEVKSLRAGGVNLKDSWVDIEDGELLVKGMHITPYDHGNIFNQDPLRVRRLLAHKNEIRRLHQQCKLQGYTLVPLSLYFKHGRVKMEVGLCKGKKLYDKRADAAKRDAKRSIDRAVKSNGKYLLNLFQAAFPALRTLCFPRMRKVRFYGGVKVSTGGARPGQRVAAGELL